MKQIKRPNFDQTPLKKALVEIVTEYPPHPQRGRLIYYTVTERLEIFDGTNWQPLKAGYADDAGIIKNQTTSNTTTTTLWTRIATFTFPFRYATAGVVMLLTGVPSTTGLPWTAMLYLNAIQQSAFAADPFGRLCIGNNTGLSTTNVKAIVTVADASSSVIEVWIEAVHTYKTFRMRVLDDFGSCTKDYTLSAWTAAANLPAGSELSVVQLT